MFKRIGIIILGFGLIAMSASLWYVVQSMQKSQRQKSENAEVILQQMQAVARLVTAEGYFSEIYRYKDYYHWDVGLLRKKALLRVNAKVSLGYDLERLDFHIDSETKRIVISDPGMPEIIAMEHDIGFYDLTSGTFNRFSEDDLNTLKSRAKHFIREVALQSDLVDLANERKQVIFQSLGAIAITAGYELYVAPVTEIALLP